MSPMLELSDVLPYFMEWQHGETPLGILLSTPDRRFAFDCTLVRFFDTASPFNCPAIPIPSTSTWMDTISRSLNEAAANVTHEELSAHPVYRRGLKANGGGRTLLILEILP